MRKTLSRILAWALCVAMLLCWLPQVPVFAASSYPNTHVNTGNMAADIVAVAVTQAGYCEGSLSGNPANASTNNYQKFGQWYDQNVDNIGVTRAAWCAAFVSWCANQAGVPSSIVYYHAYCPYGVNWFRNQGRFQYAASRGGSYTPKAGDIVYFAPAGSSTSSHVGIVRYVKNGYVYTVEGNTGGQNGEVNEGGGVFLKSYALSYSRLYGYGTPAYTDNSGHTVTFDSNGGSSVAKVNVKDGSTLTAPANPTRYGFNFVGWYCDPGLNDPYNFSTPVSYGFTLYAKWEEAYWGANTNLMPVDGLLVCNDFQSTGQYIWPYYNDDGSVTMYNGVTNDANWSWPSACMSYENSFDSGNDAYIYVKYNATANFNATIDYLDADGNPQSVTLSQLYGTGDKDLPAGYNEFFVNFGQYAYDQGHLTPSDGSAHSRNIKYTKVTYYVVGGLDSYVRLYDMKLTAAFEIPDPYVNLMTNSITQDSGYGSYVYDNGKLTVNASTDMGYTVTLYPNASVNPTDMGYLLANLQSDVPFNISVALTRADGDAVMELRKEFYPLFGLAETPEALPAGTWEPVMDFNAYFAWNGGSVTESTVKSITVTLQQEGTLTMDALQVHKGIVAKTVADGLYAADSAWAPAGSLLPVSGKLQYVGFQETGESVWDYYNDDGSVTLYNTVDGADYSWPSGYMVYENTVDLNATPDLYLNFRCDYGFNGEITYLDADGAEHTVNLSTLANLDTTDFTAGTYDLYLDFASYVEAQGHTPSDGILKLTRVTYYVVGVKNSYARLYDMRFCVEPAVTEIKLSHPTVSFEDEVRYNIYYSATETDQINEMGLLVFDTQMENGTYAEAAQVFSGYESVGDLFVVHTGGISAKKMGDDLYFRVYAKLADGSYVYSKAQSYNVVSYARGILNGNSGAAMKALVVAALNYGTQAQQYFGYRTDSLMNSSLTAEQLALVESYRADMVTAVSAADPAKAGIFTNSGGFSKRYPTVSFEGAFSINYYFVPSNVPNSTVRLYYWTQEAYDSATTLTPGNASGVLNLTVDENGEYHTMVEGIAAKDLCSTVYVAAGYNSGSNTYCTGVLAYSIGIYCKAQAEGTSTMQDFAAATAVYSYYASEYFNA